MSHCYLEILSTSSLYSTNQIGFCCEIKTKIVIGVGDRVGVGGGGDICYGMQLFDPPWLVSSGCPIIFIKLAVLRKRI